MYEHISYMIHVYEYFVSIFIHIYTYLCMKNFLLEWFYKCYFVFYMLVICIKYLYAYKINV